MSLKPSRHRDGHSALRPEVARALQEQIRIATEIGSPGFRKPAAPCSRIGSMRSRLRRPTPRTTHETRQVLNTACAGDQAEPLFRLTEDR
jgi:hypothetical protein